MGRSVLFVVALATLLCAACVTAAEPMFPADVINSASKYVNTTITVRGRVSNSAKVTADDAVMDAKYKYELAYGGSSITIYTNKVVDDGQPATVTGKLRYQGDRYYIIDSRAIPVWMYAVGAGLVVVLLVVVVLIIVTSGRPIRTAGKSLGYCDQHGVALNDSGICPVCASGPATGPVVGPAKAGTVEVTGVKSKKDTVLVDKPSKALLVLKNSGRGQTGTYSISGGPTQVGRNGENDFVIDEETVSGIHAKIAEEAGKFFIHDLASTNHTYVNGEPVVRQMLNDGDMIRLGNAEMKFVIVSEK